MEFKNYGMIIFGNTKNVLEEVVKICEGNPNVLDAKGIMILTYQSVIEVKELTDYFKINKRSFAIFELNEKNSGLFFQNRDVQAALVDSISSTNLSDLTENLKKILMSTTAETKTNEYITTEVKNNIEEMSELEKNELLNSIIDKGVKNLSDNDKDLLIKLSTT